MGNGAKLKELLKAKGMTVRELADSAGIPSTTLYSIIQNDSQIKPGYTESLSKALNINPNILAIYLCVDFVQAEEALKALYGDNGYRVRINITKRITEIMKAKQRNEISSTPIPCPTTTCSHGTEEKWSQEEIEEIELFKEFLRHKHEGKID